LLMCLVEKENPQKENFMSYKPSWNSLKTHITPTWFQDAKFRIYTHWGIYFSRHVAQTVPGIPMLCTLKGHRSMSIT